jgi:hypothetical protein
MTWDSERARELGRRGAAARWAKPRPGDPFAGTFVDFMDLAGLTGPSWAAWRAHWKAIDALPMDAGERETFCRCTGRTTPPVEPVREVWDVCGRRSGKTRGASARAFYEGIRRDYRTFLAPGERAVIPVIAADRKQARQALAYIRGLVQVEAFAPFVARLLKEAIELTTGVTLEVFSGSLRLTRGYSIGGVVADEVAFWRSEDSSEPDREILNALRPGMATLPDALLLCLSTPYARRGEVWRNYDSHYGQDGDPVLVWRADSRTMNPTLAAAVIARAYEDDPAVASAEWGAEFRRDVAGYVDLESVRAVTVPGRRELPPRRDVAFVAFVDAAGGSGGDSFTVAIAHGEGERAVLDVVREVRPSFSPEAVVEEYAGLLRTYGVSEVTGDRYAGEWPREQFRKHGITYAPSERTKSDLYRELLPLVNAGRVELLDLPRLLAQLVGLERRVARSGKDSIDHAPGGHDDVANAAAGALVVAQGGAGQITELEIPSLLRAEEPEVACGSEYRGVFRDGAAYREGFRP